MNQEVSSVCVALNELQNALEKINIALNLFEGGKIEKYSDIFIKALLQKGKILLLISNGTRDTDEFKLVRQECAQILCEVFKSSKLFEEYAEGISEGIFDDTEVCERVLEVCGPLEKEGLFREGRAKEKWRMLVLETSHLIKGSEE